jgi:large subunit ribosomal protein L17
MAASLFLHGKIVTTVAKAKDLRPFAEKLITRARRGSIHDRRIIASKLRHPEAEKKLFAEIAEQYRNRPGGYTSIHKLSGNRLGDNAPRAILELVTWDPGDKPKAKRRKKTPQRQKRKVGKEAAPEKVPAESEQDQADTAGEGEAQGGQTADQTVAEEKDKGDAEPSESTKD